MRRLYVLELIAAGLLLAWGLTAGVRGCSNQQGQQAEHQAAVAEGEANVHVQQADHLKAEAQAEREARKQAEANLDRLKKENAALLRRLAAKPVPSVPVDQGAPPADTPDPVGDVRDAVIEKQQEIIEEQDKVIESQAKELVLVRHESAENRAALEAERRRAVGLQISLDAQKHVRSSERWTGRFEGVGVGTGFGFLLKALL